jgi:hypothetical protein
MAFPSLSLQAPSPTPPPAPATPAPATPAPAAQSTSPDILQPHQFDVPRNADGASWLAKIGSQLSDQLISARGRRFELSKQYEVATGTNREGLAAQLRILDRRIEQLELDIAEVGRLKTQMPPTSGTAQPIDWNFGPRFAGTPPGVLPALLAFFVVFPLAMTGARWLWRRSAKPVAPPGWTDAADRLERVEQALETIAIEVERVSEGQRYISRILTQQAGGVPATAPELNGGQPIPALGAGSPDPIVMQQQREEVRVRRG